MNQEKERKKRGGKEGRRPQRKSLALKPRLKQRVPPAN